MCLPALGWQTKFNSDRKCNRKHSCIPVLDKIAYPRYLEELCTMHPTINLKTRNFCTNTFCTVILQKLGEWRPWPGILLQGQIEPYTNKMAVIRFLSVSFVKTPSTPCPPFLLYLCLCRFHYIRAIMLFNSTSWLACFQATERSSAWHWVQNPTECRSISSTPQSG